LLKALKSTQELDESVEDPPRLDE